MPIQSSIPGFLSPTTDGQQNRWSLSVRDGGEAMVVKEAEEEREMPVSAVVEGSGKNGKVPPVAQLLKHPLALLALVPSSVALFAPGAGAGAVSKTVTAPLDRVEILMQRSRERLLAARYYFAVATRD